MKKSIVMLVVLLVLMTGCAKWESLKNEPSNAQGVTAPVANAQDEVALADADLNSSQSLEDDLSFKEFDDFESDIDDVKW